MDQLRSFHDSTFPDNTFRHLDPKHGQVCHHDLLGIFQDLMVVAAMPTGPTAPLVQPPTSFPANASVIAADPLSLLIPIQLVTPPASMIFQCDGSRPAHHSNFRCLCIAEPHALVCSRAPSPFPSRRGPHRITSEFNMLSNALFSF